MARRILTLSQKVKLFSSITHLTDRRYIANILDGCLYGRENLLNSYTEFSPAALHDCDVRDGDGNVICMGPNMIDPKSLNVTSIGLQFDLNALLENKPFARNPCIFYKQADFGYELESSTQVDTLRNYYINIALNNYLRCQNRNCLNLQLTGSSRMYYSEIPKFFFISYNLSAIHQILTLNFFRFLDTLNDQSESLKIYQALGKLGDDELLQFLNDLGKAMTQTTEFNFFGAHKIDMSALKGLKFYKDYKIDWQVDIEELIAKNNAHDSSLVDKLKENLPEIFLSTRFTDYLQSNNAFHIEPMSSN